MKKYCAVAVLAVVVAACVDAPTSPRSLSGSEPSLAATATTTSERIDNSFLGHVPCANGGAGENVEFSGTLHVTEHRSISNSGHMVIHFTFNPQGITGVGLVTGDTYRSVGQTGLIVRWRAGQPFSNTYSNNFLVIGPGKGNNFLVHELIQVASNAHGDVTAEVVKIEILCK